MASEEKKENKEMDKNEAPLERNDKSDNMQEANLDNEFFVSNVMPKEQISERDIFAGNEDFYKLLSDSMEDPQDGFVGTNLKIQSKPSKSFVWIKRFLIAAIVTITATLGYAIIKNQFGLFHGPVSSNANQVATAQQEVEPVVVQEIEQIEEEIKLSSDQPVSLEIAKNFYEQKEYEKAYQVYERLFLILPEGEELVKDYLRLQMSLCSEKERDFEKAYNLLTLVSESRSPAVRIIANYRLAIIEIQRKRYLRARTRAYKALALLKSVDFNDDWELAFECDCNYLVAQCLTRYILSLSDTTQKLPEDFWSQTTAFADPLENLNERDLKIFLESGIDQLYQGLLEPKIKQQEGQGLFARWSVTCFGASLEEFISKFAINADFDIQWVSEVGSESETDGNIIRQRPVSLYISSAPSEQIMLIAAGSAELLAAKQEGSEEEKYLIYNPSNYLSLNEHVKLLSLHAISLWQKFMLTFHADQRLGNVHFAMGLLQTLTDQKNDAIAEYKLVANRFSQISLAPYALMKSSELKSEIRDYQGAREDLRQLIEQYPDSKVYRDAYLRLADVTRQAGQYIEAAQMFTRVYNFELSESSKIEATYGAANCFYEAQVYEEAEIWFNRYINFSGNKTKDELYSAYFLLGKTCLELKKYEQACDSFQYAISEQSSREQYIEAIKALVQGYIEKEDFVKALDVLENTRSVSLSQQQYVEMLIQRSTIYRNLGLFETAIDLLRDRSDFITETQLNAEIYFEMANCFIANGNLEKSRSSLSEVLRIAEPGEISQKAAKKMAQICLDLGYSAQAVSVCRQLLDTDISGNLKNEVKVILAQALNQQKNYEEAALVLSVQD